MDTWWSEVGVTGAAPEDNVWTWPAGLCASDGMAQRVGAATRPWRTIDRHPVGTSELAQAIASHRKPFPSTIPIIRQGPLLFSGFWCVHTLPAHGRGPPGFGGLGFYFEVFRVTLDLPPIGVSPPEYCYLK